MTHTRQTKQTQTNKQQQHHSGSLTGFDLKQILRVRRIDRKEMLYLTTHSTHFIYGYMMSDIG